MKVTLINPPYLFGAANLVCIPQILGLRYISAFLKQDGKHTVNFIDALLLGRDNVKKYANGVIAGLDYEDIISRIHPDTNLIGLSIPFSQIAPIGHDIVALIKQKYPKMKIAMGGVYPSTQPALAVTSQADYVVVGEGEQAMLRLANGETEIKGVYTPGDKGRVSFPATDVIDDLNLAPMMDTNIPNLDDYFLYSPRKTFVPKTASIITSRACPYLCDFCSIHAVYGTKWRYRSAENVIKEIRHLVVNHGIEKLEIEDDNFTLRQKRAIDILNGIIQINREGHNLSWRVPNGVRADRLSDELIDVIGKSNCDSISLGIEHGDAEMLKIMRKQLNLAVAYHTVKKLAKVGVKQIHVFVIIGHPGETRERFESCLNYMKKLNNLGAKVFPSVHITQPYPGTPLTKECIEKGYVKIKHIDNYLLRRDVTSTSHTVTITTPDFDEEEIYRRKKVMEEAFKEKYIARGIKELPSQFKKKIDRLRSTAHAFIQGRSD